MQEEMGHTAHDWAAIPPQDSSKLWRSNVVFVGQLTAPLTTGHNLESMLQHQEHVQPHLACGAPHRAQAETQLFLL